MYYFKYRKIYNKYNNLNNSINVNYRLNRAVKIKLNKSIKQPLIQTRPDIDITSNNNGKNKPLKQRLI